MKTYLPHSGLKSQFLSNFFLCVWANRKFYKLLKKKDRVLTFPWISSSCGCKLQQFLEIKQVSVHFWGLTSNSKI